MSRYDHLASQLLSLLDGEELPLPRNDDDIRGEQRIAITIFELFRITPEHWTTLAEVAREPWLEKAIHRLRDDSPLPLEHQEKAAKKLLTGWHAICAALNMPYGQRNEIKSLNGRLEGPIVNKGRGTKPMVLEEVLVNWWNRLAVQQEELANRKLGNKLSAEIQYDYGHDATVAPEISGSVKNRRRRKQS